MACTKEEQSLSQLQRRLEMSLPKLHHHVSRLLALKLLVISRTEARSGRPVRYYRAVAESFLMSQALLAQLPSDRWARLLRLSLHDAYSEVDDLSFLCYANQSGDPSFKGMSPSALSKPVRVQDICSVLCLTAAQRAALAKEMMDLVSRYARAAEGRSSEKFLVYAAFAPMLQDDSRRNSK